jgi:hypothetical protein
MPVINLEFDNGVVSEDEAMRLSKAIRDIVSESTDVTDVFVYTNTAHIKIQIAPIEIFIRLSKHIAEGKPDLLKDVKNKLTDWKAREEFMHPINLTVIPMVWSMEIGI